MPTPRYDTTTFIQGSKIYVLGLWLKPERSLSMKTKRADFASGYLCGRVIAAGGLGNQPTVLGSVEAFLPGKKKWELLPSLPTPRCSASSIMFHDRLLVVGGVSQGPSCAVEALSVQQGEGP
ncbi:kelch domain-containing protein 8A-like [Acipenser oxyrinchus oxyrinchus]|uniref:Kelch domain-containing protein 8A-like n=1 Tax=Acipenser oxyrinchus oxyrinchus TaxID=40147 RepID=A0AAD8FQB6_ACIOX|nr:kelch domain-containing protein 8A-like [Acipenser oxyrinchus oxyrinchus]